MKFVTVKQSGTSITGQVYVGTTHTAIQNAINYVSSQGGGVVFIEKGIYTISSPIILQSNIEICGEWIHTILKANFSNSGTNAVLSVYNSSNVYIHDLVIGNNVKTTALGKYGIYAEFCGYDITSGAITNKIYNPDLLGKDYDVEFGIRIEDCIVQGNLNSGIYLTYTSNSSISNCTVEYNLQKGIYVSTSCINIRVKNNIIQNNGEGITQINSYNNLYSNNIIQNSYTVGINLYYNCVNTIVIGNLTHSNSGDGIGMLNSKNNSLIANSSQDNGDYSIFIYLSDSNTVCGNFIFNSNENVLNLNSSSLNSIVGNGIFSSNENGLYLDSDSTYNSITGNSIHDNITGLNINGSYNTITGNVSITSDNNLLNSGGNNIIAVNKTTNSA